MSLILAGPHDLSLRVTGSAAVAIHSSASICWISDPFNKRFSDPEIWIAGPFTRRPMRADAKKNYVHLLAVAREVVDEHGPEASMRDIARRAEVGLATLLRHFPTREALFEALLRSKLDALIRRSDELEASTSPDQALLSWFQEWVAFALSHQGVVAMLAAAHTEPDSALYAACAAVHAASGRLLVRAQVEGTARIDMNGDDLFGLMCALGWLVDLPPFAPRADHLLQILADAILSESAEQRGG